MAVSIGAALTGNDRANILDLYGRYALAIDFGDGSEWADCFTPDGTFSANRGEGMDPIEIAGHDALDAFARNHRNSPSGKTRHHFTNIATNSTNGVVIGRAAIFYVEGRTVLCNGLYLDQIRCDGDSWLFVRREVTHERLRP